MTIIFGSKYILHSGFWFTQDNYKNKFWPPNLAILLAWQQIFKHTNNPIQLNVEYSEGEQKL